MGLPSQRREMVDVELVEELEDGTLAAPGEMPGARGRARGERRRLRDRLGVRVGGVALAVVVAVTTVVAGRLRDGDGGSTAFVGASPSLVSPLVESWRVPAAEGWSVAAGLLLTPVRTGAQVGVDAHELSSGALRWTVPLPAGTGAVQCPVAVMGSTGPEVVCQALGQLRTPPGPGRWAVQDPGHLVLVSASDGAVVADEVLPPQHLGLAEVEGDLVVATVDDGTVHVVRRDVATGAPLWEASVEVGVTAVPATRLAVVEGLVVVSGPTTAVLDGEDGHRLGTWLPGQRRSHDVSRAEVTSGPGGFGVRTDTGARAASTTWYGRDGAPRGAFDGQVTEPALSDGSQPGTVLTATSGWGALRGVDVASGEALWSVDLDEGHPVLRLDGRVVLAGRGVVRSLDVRTGHEVWRARADALDDVQAVSDGRFVLATGTALGVGTSISAISLRDGSLLWRTAMPPGGAALEVAGGAVLAVGHDVVIGLG